MAPPVVLVITSHVAASRVGLAAVTPALAAWGVETIAAPTVVFGRHPGWGAPGGRGLAPPVLTEILTGALAHPDAARAAWAVTGYFADARQVTAAADALARLKDQARDVKICVDPVMGDADTGRYVAPDVPKLIERRLLPLADLVAPNAWEAEQLTGVRVLDAVTAAEAARAFGRPTVVSTVRANGRIGAVWADTAEAWFAHAPHRDTPVRGTGDLLTGAVVGALTQKRTPKEALETAVALLDFSLHLAETARLHELPGARVAAFGATLPPAPSSAEVVVEPV